jgi:Transposase DDE domain
MAYNFLRGDRDQPFLLPPDLRDWLPIDHLAWFILDVIGQVDLDPFYRVHRNDGHDQAAYDPKTLLGVLLSAYATGVRSSRQTVEPVFGQIKEQQGARRFLRRGMRARQAEWKLLCGTHNLLKLWRHTATQRATRPATA